VSRDRGTVVWAPDPFKSGDSNPRPWLLVSAGLPYDDSEAIGVAFTSQSHHPGSLAVSTEAWLRGEPDRQSHVLPWTVATLKTDGDVVGVQGTVTRSFTDAVVSEIVSYLDDE